MIVFMGLHSFVGTMEFQVVKSAFRLHCAMTLHALTEVGRLGTAGQQCGLYMLRPNVDSIGGHALFGLLTKAPIQQHSGGHWCTWYGGSGIYSTNETK